MLLLHCLSHVKVWHSDMLWWNKPAPPSALRPNILYTGKLKQISSDKNHNSSFLYPSVVYMFWEISHMSKGWVRAFFKKTLLNILFCPADLWTRKTFTPLCSQGRVVRLQEPSKPVNTSNYTTFTPPAWAQAYKVFVWVLKFQHFGFLWSLNRSGIPDWRSKPSGGCAHLSNTGFKLRFCNISSLALVLYWLLV